jgi:hypothetical protein
VSTIPRYQRGTVVAPRADDPFSCMGHPIPTEAQAEAVEHAVSFGVQPFTADGAVQEAAAHLAADNPDAALRALMSCMDLTGAYRLMAVMLAGVAATAQH